VKRTIAILTILIAALPLRVLAQDASPVPDGTPEGLPDQYTVARVVGHMDGDKIRVQVGTAPAKDLNFIQADADEPGECFYSDATKGVKKLLPVGTTVFLESDRKLTDGKDRLLRWVWAVDRKGQQVYLVNSKLVRDGLAVRKTIGADGDNKKYSASMKAAHTAARQRDNGLWELCGGPHRDSSRRSTSTPDPRTPIATATPRPAPTATPDGREYLSDVKEAVDYLPDTFATVDAVMAGDSSVEPTTFIIALAYWIYAYDDFSGRVAPPQYADLHNQLIAMLSDLDTAATLIDEGSREQDNGKILAGVALYKAGVTKFYAFKATFDPIAVGAGL
jgi:endonuclease YncB( thermonuclease family)